MPGILLGRNTRKRFWLLSCRWPHRRILWWGLLLFMTVFIYTLGDPETKRIRYVGKTVNVHRRLLVHMNEKRGTHKNNWLRGLKSKGLKPLFSIIETIFDSSDLDWQPREIFWINHYRSMGELLTNLDGGGHGGRIISEETRIKISLSKTGKRIDPAQAKRAADAQRGIKRSPEFCERQRQAALKRRQSTETREKLRLIGLKREASKRALTAPIIT